MHRKGKSNALKKNKKRENVNIGRRLIKNRHEISNNNNQKKEIINYENLQIPYYLIFRFVNSLRYNICIYLFNNSFTIAEIILPSALPANCLEATPMTFPISAGDEAPTDRIILPISVFISSSVICFGK